MIEIEQNVVVSMPPKKTYKVELIIKSIKKGELKIIIEE